MIDEPADGRTDRQTDRQIQSHVDMPSRVWMDLYMAIHYYFWRFLAIFLKCQWTCILTDGHTEKQRNLFWQCFLSIIIFNLCICVIHFHFSTPDSNLVTDVETKYSQKIISCNLPVLRWRWALMRRQQVYHFLTYILGCAVRIRLAIWLFSADIWKIWFSGFLTLCESGFLQVAIIYGQKSIKKIKQIFFHSCPWSRVGR